MNDSIRRMLRLAFEFALAFLPAPAAFAYSAHYFADFQGPDTIDGHSIARSEMSRCKLPDRANAWRISGITEVHKNGRER